DFLQFSDTTVAVGTVSTVIETQGVTNLTHVGNRYFLYDSNGSGPSLKFGGVDFVDAWLGTWALIGAEKTATGYEVAWKEASTGNYMVWNTDSNGNYVSDIGVVSGASSTLKSLEPSFHQDPNGDGVIGGAGPAQAAIVSGTAGNDVLTSTAANEVLFGNGGHDTFVFAGNFGKDTVADFHAESDVLLFSHVTFADV